MTGRLPLASVSAEDDECFVLMIRPTSARCSGSTTGRPGGVGMGAESPRVTVSAELPQTSGRALGHTARPVMARCGSGRRVDRNRHAERVSSQRSVKLIPGNRPPDGDDALYVCPGRKRGLALSRFPWFCRYLPRRP